MGGDAMITLELADICNRFADGYLAKHGASVLPSHRHAIADIRACRTEALGGHLYRCNHCQTEVHAFHSCKNRHCPKCHSSQTQTWLESRRDEMLPIEYFHVTVTIPEELRELFRSNQKTCYSLFMSATKAAILELAQDPRYIGGMVGILMVLHTWTRDLLYHPHLHCLVTGGGITDDGQSWISARKGFLFPLKPLARLIRGKLMAAFAHDHPELILPPQVWDKEWVTHCTPWGVGEQAILDYLARYAFRIAINNSRLVSMDDETVTFRYQNRDTGQWKNRCIPGEEFIRRFLQHVLPQRFHKIRYFGLWHPTKRKCLQRIRMHLLLEQKIESVRQVKDQETPSDGPSQGVIREGAPCQACGAGTLTHIKSIRRLNARGP
jgi:hypothetical protein